MTEAPGSFGNDTQHLFVDEAGDPTLFDNRRRAIVGIEGCSRFFILGKLRRGASDRNEALRLAIIEHAEKDYEDRHGYRRGIEDGYTIEVTMPERHQPLQAVDYFLWALQRYFWLIERFGVPTK